VLLLVLVLVEIRMTASSSHPLTPP